MQNQKTHETSAKAFKKHDQLLVSDIMSKDPIVVNQNESIDTAIALLTDNNIRHLPVVDPQGDIQGIISDRDLLNTVMENLWSKKQVKHVMTKTPETVDPETTLFEAGNILLENKIDCLPVVEGNHLVGIITSTDFVRLASQSL